MNTFLFFFPDTECTVVRVSPWLSPGSWNRSQDDPEDGHEAPLLDITFTLKDDGSGTSPDVSLSEVRNALPL
jgi:hypothetical protein